MFGVADDNIPGNFGATTGAFFLTTDVAEGSNPTFHAEGCSALIELNQPPPQPQLRRFLSLNTSPQGQPPPTGRRKAAAAGAGGGELGGASVGAGWALAGCGEASAGGRPGGTTPGGRTRLVEKAVCFAYTPSSAFCIVTSYRHDVVRVVEHESLCLFFTELGYCRYEL